MKNRMVSPVSSGSLPQSFMTHSLCLPRTVSPICRQSHSPASPLLLVGFGVCLAAVNLGDFLKEE